MIYEKQRLISMKNNKETQLISHLGFQTESNGIREYAWGLVEAWAWLKALFRGRGSREPGGSHVFFLLGGGGEFCGFKVLKNGFLFVEVVLCLNC